MFGPQTASQLSRVTEFGLLERHGLSFVAKSPALLEAAAAMTKEGIPPRELLDVISVARPHFDAIARLLVDLVVKRLDRYDEGTLPPVTDVPALVDAIWRLRPLAAVFVEAETNRALENAASAYLGGRVATILDKKLSDEAARQASASALPSTPAARPGKATATKHRTAAVIFISAMLGLRPVARATILPTERHTPLSEDVSHGVRSMIRFTRWIARIAVTALAVAAATSALAQGSADKVVRIGYQKAGLLSVLKSQGALEARLKPLGYDVQWFEFPAGPQLLEALNASSIDFGYTGAPPPVFAQAAGVRFVYVAAEPPSPHNEAVFVKADSPVRSLSELRGKKVALQKGSSANYLLLEALKKAGVRYDEIRPVYLPPADARAAFKAATSMHGPCGTRITRPPRIR
jgi:ABC-type amino acid transport substrate-binding protein